MAFNRVTLLGRRVELTPLLRDHADPLAEAVRDGELWRIWYTAIPSPEAMEAEINRRLGLEAAGSMLPFTVLDGPGGRPIGMTTYMNIETSGPRMEIGSTWYAARVQRTLLNTEAKLLGARPKPDVPSRRRSAADTLLERRNSAGDVNRDLKQTSIRLTDRAVELFSFW
jgi:RimJ/RimL family protein N-acetyltransferase